MNLPKLFYILLFLSSPAVANNYFHPKLSPDESKLAFYGYVNNVPDIFILDFRTQRVSRFTNTSDNWEIEPRWLDNHTITYASGKNMQSLKQIRTPINQPNETEILSGNMFQFPADFQSESGKLIVNRKYPDGWQMLMVDLVDKSEKYLSIPQNWIGHSVDWKKRDLLVTNGEAIRLMDFDGTLLKELHHTKGKMSFPTIIENGKQLLFILENEGQTDIWWKDLESGKLRQLTKDGKPKYSPQWLSKQKLIAYSTRKAHSVDIVLMDIDGKETKNITLGLKW